MSSVINAAERTVDHTRGSLVELGTQALKLINTFRAMETRGVESLLHRVGLQRRESPLGGVIWFAAGAVAAGAVVALLVPASRKQLREQITRILDKVPAKTTTSAPADLSTATPSNGAKHDASH